MKLDGKVVVGERAETVGLGVSTWKQILQNSNGNYEASYKTL